MTEDESKAEQLGRSELSVLLDKAARLAGQRIEGGRFGDLDRIFSENDAQGADDQATLFITAWQAAGLENSPDQLEEPSPADLPFAAHIDGRGWLLVVSRSADGTWRGESTEETLTDLETATCLSLPQRSRSPRPVPSASSLVRQALLQRKGVLVDAVLATGLISLLALATSLYALQVYDRVIPNQGYQTLLVLTVGIIVAILFELVIKHVRGRLVDRTSSAVDRQLSEWFFKRMMSIRMEARPPSVGTLASQVKGFEMVRGVLASTSIFVCADVPFAILFLLVIAAIGGWVVVVPLVALPIALTAGLMFQRTIQRHTRRNLTGSNRKAGLLVEAVDGAETLKANSAEWAVQSRWNRLVAETGDAEQSTRKFSVLSQNITVAFQQLSYITLIAVGAYLVTLNKMTMGGLIACAIISNRAMTPIIQLPGVMLQWALARAALDGLQQIIALPNEEDDAHTALVPQQLEGGYLFERARFVYGAAKQVALEIERLEIKPGECVGLIGPIGSGKSTLLKLASGLYRPAEGKVFLGGVDLAMLAPSVAREMIGYLPQETRLFSGTLRDNLLLGLPDPGEEAILAAANRTGLINLILGQPAGLALELTEGGRGVSGGQKQLIALTRMLLAKPKIWLLDEPTGAMDSASEMRVVSLLRELAGDGVTLVVTTHKTALLPILDRLVVLHGGRLQLDGPRDAVLQKLAAPKPQSSKEKAA